MIVQRFDLAVSGEPIPQARAGRGRHGSYVPKRSAEYRERIQAAWMISGRPTLGSASFSLSVRFYRATQRPCDLDNLLKAVCDALNGLAFTDDKQLVCISGAHKLECARGEERTELTLWVATAAVP